jgi:hypothetical protein
VIARALLLLIATCGAAQAQDPKSLGAFNDWTAYSAGGRGALICYVYGEPKDTAPDNIKRGPVYVQVAHRQKDKVMNELSVTAGYPYKKDSEAELEIDGGKFLLFTKDESAWARDDKTEDAVVKAMRAGKRMIVRGTSTRGTKTTDTYSLAGFGAALNAINTACATKSPVS